MIPLWQRWLIYLCCAGAFVMALLLLRLAWRVAASLFRQDEVVEAAVREEWAGLVERGELRPDLHLPGPASSHRGYEGTLDGRRVSLLLMSGNNKGWRVSRTEITVRPTSAAHTGVTLHATGERGREPHGLAFADVVRVAGSDAARVEARLGPVAERLVAFVARRGGELRVDDEALRWITRDLVFQGEGEALLRELVALADEIARRLAAGDA